MKSTPLRWIIQPPSRLLFYLPFSPLFLLPPLPPQTPIAPVTAEFSYPLLLKERYVERKTMIQISNNRLDSIPKNKSTPTPSPQQSVPKPSKTLTRLSTSNLPPQLQNQQNTPPTKKHRRAKSLHQPFPVSPPPYLPALSPIFRFALLPPSFPPLAPYLTLSRVFKNNTTLSTNPINPARPPPTLFPRIPALANILPK